MRRFPSALAAVLLAGVALPALPALAQAPATPPSAGAPAPAAPATGAPPAAAPAPGALATAPVLPPVSPEAHAEAAKLTAMIGVNRQSEQLVGIMRGQMIQLVMRSANKPPAEATKIVDEVLMPDFLAQESQLTNEIIDVWARNFTLDDLKGLEAFYQTPLGQKLIHTLPAVTQEGMQAGQSWGQRVYQAAITKHKDELILRGLKF
jgi:hypothetical protein